MLKKILKSLLVLGVLGVTLGGATKAWFTSQVTAADNEITTGTLMLAIDSSQEHGYRDAGSWAFPLAYTVVEDIDGVETTYDHTFETWANAEPGVSVPFTNVWPKTSR